MGECSRALGHGPRIGTPGCGHGGRDVSGQDMSSRLEYGQPSSSQPGGDQSRRPWLIISPPP